MRSRRRHLTSAVLVAVLLAACTTSERYRVPEVTSLEPAARLVPASAPDPTLTVMTLNLAHGRGTGFHQLFQREARTERNLDEVRELLARESPDVVALQEADAPSVWSGGFDHVAYVAHDMEATELVRGVHASGLGLHYGTALLATQPLADPLAVTFPRAVVPAPKGFVVATVGWPSQPHVQIDVVSVHLHFLGAKRRDRQASELVRVLRERDRPVIVMGDFNSQWQDDSAVRTVAGELELRAFEPERHGLPTFPRLGRRLDWILVSHELEFVSHRVLEDPVSDHRAVVAEIRLSAPGMRAHEDSLAAKSPPAPIGAAGPAKGLAEPAP